MRASAPGAYNEFDMLLAGDAGATEPLRGTHDQDNRDVSPDGTIERSGKEGSKVWFKEGSQVYSNKAA